MASARDAIEPCVDVTPQRKRRRVPLRAEAEPTELRSRASGRDFWGKWEGENRQVYELCIRYGRQGDGAERGR